MPRAIQNYDITTKRRKQRGCCAPLFSSWKSRPFLNVHLADEFFRTPATVLEADQRGNLAQSERICSAVSWPHARRFDATKSAATPQKQTTSDKREDPHNHSSGHARPESRALEAVVRSVDSKVVHRMPEVQRGDQNSNSGQDVQDSHRRSHQKVQCWNIPKNSCAWNRRLRTVRGVPYSSRSSMSGS
jgi:hypothetical protein